MNTRKRVAWRRSFGNGIVLLALALVLPAVLHADEADQARRLHHFEVLQAHGVFESMAVVDGVPTLTLGAWQEQTDAASLGPFSTVIYEYYVELDPQYTELRVVDGASGQQIAVVDANGYHAVE